MTGGGSGGGGTQTFTPAPLSPEEKALVAKQVEFADFALAELGLIKPLFAADRDFDQKLIDDILLPDLGIRRRFAPVTEVVNPEIAALQEQLAAIPPSTPAVPGTARTPDATEIEMAFRRRLDQLGIQEEEGRSQTRTGQGLERLIRSQVTQELSAGTPGTPAIDNAAQRATLQSRLGALAPTVEGGGEFIGFEEIPDTPEEIRARLVEQALLDKELRNLGIDPSLINDEIERITGVRPAVASGQFATQTGEGALSTNQLIEQAVDTARARALTEAQEFEEANLNFIINELAPSLGLRPGDTPLQDRGNLIARETQKQFGKISQELAAQEAQLKLQFPLAKSAQETGQVGQQQQFQEALKQFQEGLRQTAFGNRQALLGQTGSLGLGLATGGIPNLAGTLGALNRGGGTTTVSGGGGGFNAAGAAGGLGSLLQGGAAAYKAFSSRAIKNIHGSMDGKDALSMMAKLDVGLWEYLEDPDATPHVGPYAEDFKEVTGLGDGVSIDIRDLLGIVMAGVKELAEQRGVA
jgi:hypothetical protein